jgi:eukaryotic-like serine/threonine-protein kinase
MRRRAIVVKDACDRRVAWGRIDVAAGEVYEPIRVAVYYADTERAQSKPRSRRTWPTPVRLGSLPAGSEQDLRFVQDRIALFAKTTLFISTMFLVATGAADALTDVHRFSTLGRISHVFGTLIALGLWRVAGSRRSYSPSMLQALDVAGTLAICWAFTFMGHDSLQPYGFYTSLLAVTHVSITRAMVVPSIPRQTLVLAVLGFAGFVVSRATMPWPPELALVAGSRGRGIIEAVLWSTAGAAVATVASTVIYGLHERAREARQLGQYSLEEKIGQGGMGEVYRARHAMLRRPTAVKLLAGDGSEDELRRFEREVQLTARLTHPNTISIYDYGRTPDGVFYYAMELLDGLTLHDLVERHGPQPAARVIHILRQVCGALREAHRSGLIHRDVKPANIILCRRGDVPDFVKVLDFGLVREIKSASDPTRSSVEAVVGTPLFLSPEAISTPDRVDARADIYGLASVAYFLVTATTPFSGKSVVEVCAHQLHTAPEPPSRREPVPADLERVILSCLAKNPDDRPQSAEALASALDLCSDAHKWTERDAEAWWSGIATSDPERPLHPAATGEPPRTTVFRVDLEKRL